MATIVTISNLSQLRNSRQVINDNFTAVNADLAAKIATPDTTSAALKYLRRNSANTDWELATVTSAGDVTGASNLTNAGRLAKVSGAGALNESIIVEASGRILIGAADNSVDKLQVGGSVLATTFKGNLDWSYVQSKPSTYAPSAHSHGNADITDVAWGKLTSVPSTFTPATHTHAESDVTGLTTDLNSKITMPDTTGAAGKFLRRNATNDGWEFITVSSGGGDVFGGGTLGNVGKVPRVTASGTLGESVIYDIGGYVGVGVYPGSTHKLDVAGNVRSTTGFVIGYNFLGYASALPTSSGTAGDVYFNSSPAAGGHMGWVCLGGTTWKRWGVIDL